MSVKLVATNRTFKGHSFSLLSGNDKTGYNYLHHFITGFQELHFDTTEQADKFWNKETLRISNESNKRTL